MVSLKQISVSDPIQHFRSMRIRMLIRIQIQIQGFDDQKLENIVIWNFFFNSVDLLYLYASVKNAHVSGEAFSSQKRTSST